MAMSSSHVVATTDPGATIRRGEEGVDLFAGEKRDKGSVCALGGDG